MFRREWVVLSLPLAYAETFCSVTIGELENKSLGGGWFHSVVYAKHGEQLAQINK